MWNTRIPRFWSVDPDPHLIVDHQNSMILERGSRPKPSPLFPGPIVRGQLSRQLSRHCSLPGSSWLSLPVPEPLEPEQNPKKPMSSSEPILDLKGDTEEALPALEEPKQSPRTRQDPPDSGNSGPPTPAPPPAEPTPGRDTEEEDPSPTNSLPWPEAPEELPARPNTLDFSKSLKKLEEVKQAGQRRGSERAAVKENGLGVTVATSTATSTASSTATSEEHRALQSELGKCIEEFRRIKIPVAFPNKKRQWQSELLKKYQL
ncbi:uncharacterized protein LOC130253015 isoform X2 [Oenanthe melanoleuca]|uniref:uncharacterized protein LOC130253015 isoform X2 n=1 Tax=Oenanthe melanoleuca TaxID=2939378 RepID=UPI0024C1CA32|nr:uncharacterized protein LOC130253015 isoform X2 [Oenanthe melanoleuca]XP_056347190.1 uncharacterized protein LOC130253015 isoform X2 [Oenanthe melanoleuca]XP_056347192.1 uncharacterized protein LOC130253015 isoform X2 [Oenanthe melanoleuca]XP_056347193.1 uncharacterized protein LOC130253015 isoform X2 [Oenanthe melanoleuca]XP_056347194.1 uncharacterized protein LOC130253015 isoform X2 [Oenanthe melanoleuca]XP_056347195.1 uncharacterized protein LOC130253015 isoform X2 [Oenanthe melanoleuca]